MSSDQDPPRERRAIAWTRIVRPGDGVDLEAEEMAENMRMTPAERFLLTAYLSDEVWEWYLAGERAREQGL